MNETIWYVYRHIRFDKNEPFYIGIGKERNFKRAYSRHDRNYHWNNIVKNTQYEVEILFENLTSEEAAKKETEFIKLHGREDLGLGPLCNLTDGGDGSTHYRHTPEARERIRQAAKNISQETRDKMSRTRKGKPAKLSVEGRERLILAATNLSDETRQKRSKALKGRTFSEETRKRMSESAKKRFLKN